MMKPKTKTNKKKQHTHTAFFIIYVSRSFAVALYLDHQISYQEIVFLLRDNRMFMGNCPSGGGGDSQGPVVSTIREWQTEGRREGRREKKRRERKREEVTYFYVTTSHLSGLATFLNFHTILFHW